MDIKQFKRETLQANIEGREQEVALYEINIWNYEHAVENCASSVPTEALDATVASLRQRIEAEKAEMGKAQIILNALRAQLAALEE